MCLLGAGTVTLASGATRSSWWVEIASSTWALRNCAHLPFSLSKRDVILIRALFNNLLAGTTHLKDRKDCIRWVCKIEKEMARFMDFSTSESSLLVLPTGAETMQEIHGPRDLANLYKIMGMSSEMDVNMIP
jgi:hypothetical protein